jgi:hypothetical protein
MDVSAGSILAPFAALTAILLGVSLLVQVLQELWKFLTSSKAIAFENALDDFVGSWASAHLRRNAALAVRGPFQFRRVKSAGHILPVDRDDLIAALEQAAPAWHRLIDRGLQFEAEMQKGSAGAPSPRFRDLLASLDAEIAAGHPSTQALEVKAFLDKWGVDAEGGFDAAKARIGLRDRFFAHLAPIEQHYDRLMQNFQYAYERRNTRQTFTFAFGVALMFNLPLAAIYARAASMPLADALALSDRAQALHAEYTKLEAETVPGAPPRPGEVEALKQREQKLRALADGALQISADRSIPTDLRNLGRDLLVNVRSLSFLVGCLLTAILVSFGAPFWNDLSTALYRVAKPGGASRGD